MKIATFTLAASIASVSAFAPSSLRSVGHFDTELNARPKLATKKGGAGKNALKAGANEPAITFHALNFPWDKPEPEPPTVKRGATLKRGKTTQKKQSIFDRVSNMDLYAPVANQNDYGARSGKKLAQGKLSQRSYVPSGMSKAQYEKIRCKDKKKKDENYAYNVKKGGKFNLFYEFYIKRGTDKNGDWKDVTNKHTMAKTKYDWQGDDDMGGFGSSAGRNFYS